MSQVTSLTLDPENSGTEVCNNITNINNAVVSNFSGTTQPTIQLNGQLWYDTTNLIHKYYNGSVWDSLYHVKDTTDSSSTSTGAFIVDGGVGIGGALYTGGNATIGSGTVATALSVNGSGTLGKYINFKSAGLNRIGIEVVNSEGGSDSGGDLYIRTYDDSGTLIDNAVSLDRKAGGTFTVKRPFVSNATRTEIGSSTYSAVSTTLTVNPPSAATSAFFNSNYSLAFVPATNAQNIGYVVGTNGIAQHCGTGTLSYLYGSMGQVYAGDGTNTPGLVSEMTAVKTGINFRANSSVTNANGFLVAAPSFGSEISVGSLYGLRVYDLKGTGVTNSYGIYVNAQSSGGYSIYTNSGLVRFGDAVSGTSTANFTGNITAGSDSSAASLNINGPNNSDKYLYLRTAGSSRWAIGSTINETGSDAGSSLYISAINDSGTYIDSPITITRAAGGLITLSRETKINQDVRIGTGVETLTRRLIVNSAAGQSKMLEYQSAGSVRWRIFSDSATESGSNAGSALVIQAHNDSGTLIDQPLKIDRAAGGAITLYRVTTCSNTESSTSTTTGSLRTLGGLGVVENIFVGGKVNLASKAASTTNGDIWQDSTQQSISMYTGGVQQQLSGVIWTKTSTTTLSNWTTAATLIGAVGTGIGTLTLPANFLKVGKTIRLRLKGAISTTSTAPTLDVAVTLGGVSIGNTSAQSLTTASMIGKAWALDLEFTCRSTGSSGTVVSVGCFTVCNSATLSYCWGLGLGTGTATVNTTTALAINVTAACGTANASNSISCVIATVEVLN